MHLVEGRDVHESIVPADIVLSVEVEAERLVRLTLDIRPHLHRRPIRVCLEQTCHDTGHDGGGERRARQLRDLSAIAVVARQVCEMLEIVSRRVDIDAGTGVRTGIHAVRRVAPRDHLLGRADPEVIDLVRTSDRDRMVWGVVAGCRHSPFEPATRRSWRCSDCWPRSPRHTFTGTIVTFFATPFVVPAMTDATDVPWPGP